MNTATRPRVKTDHLNIRIDPRVKQQLVRIAKRRRLTMSETVAELVREAGR